jgi:urease accessory protein
VGADLDVMRSDAEKVRGGRPTVLTSLRTEPEAAEVVRWVREQRVALLAG